MKRIFTFVFLMVTASSFAQTADEVIAKFIDVTGGKEKFNAINTLQYEQVIKFKSPMGELEIPLKYYKEKNKLFRLETALSFGGQSMNFFTLVNDTEGYNMLPSNPMFGMEGGLKKMTEKERTQQLHQLDASGLFSSLVDFVAKGHKVELLKDDKVNKEDVYKIRHTLATGEELTYYINKATNLVVKMDAKGAMAASVSGMGSVMNGMGGGGRMDKMSVTSLYSDYKDFDGIKFPTKIVIQSQMGELESTVANVQINKPINATLYKAQ